MKDIFNGLYKKVLGFFQNEKGENTKETATNRLKLVLLHDRTNLDTITMQKMREQLIGVISKYIEIDQEALDLNLEGEGGSVALMLNIPVIKARTKEEIEEIAAAEEEEKRAIMEAEIKAAIEAERVKEEEISDTEQEQECDESSDEVQADDDAETEEIEEAQEEEKTPEEETVEEVQEQPTQQSEEPQEDEPKKQNKKVKK